MFAILPTIGIDIEYRCAFIAWLNRVLYVGKGKKNNNYANN